MAEKTTGMRDLNDCLQTAGLDDHDVVLEAIEALKRWIYGAVYQGPVKEPVPTTEDEFALLMNGLRRWATLHASAIDTGRIQDYRRAELGLPGAFGPARVISDQLAKREWCQAAARADDALNELRILLTAAKAKKTKKRRMTQKEANERAMELAKQLGQKFFLLPEREQARLIGCAWKTWERTEFYQSAKKRKAKVLPEMGSSAPRPIRFTPKLESATGMGERDGVLNQLIAEEEANQGQGPLDGTPPKIVHSRKRV